MPIIHQDELVFRPERAGINSNWQVDDSEELWLKNKESMPDRYMEIDAVNYTYNSTGYRCNPTHGDSKELRDYGAGHLVAFGCSHTEAIGINYEECYSYLLAEKLGVDSMNLAMAGAAPNLVATNILQFVKLVLAGRLKKPKFVVVQWPGAFRRAFAQMLLYGDCYQLTSVQPSNRDHQHDLITDTYDKEWLTNRYITYTEHLNYEIYHNITSSHYLLKLLEIDVVHFQLSKDAVREDNYLLRDFNMHDIPFICDTETHARDMLHAGVESNARWASTLHDAMT